MTFLSDPILTWVLAVDVPLITAFIAAFSKLRRDVERSIDDFRDRLNTYKLEVAQNYASINHVKDLESRLIAHLLRIETKLDNTAFKIKE
jgi:hypothetical protein